ncbi:DUF5668 domain-containing protein [Clostridium sp. JN-9]|uniref:LiaI-LiaF-like domain-containing protein n=1 Tax=Clostridium sp. JN-9 TaxID=2507159 RepID=UPI000FFE2017|nr:DUF5668 domain-containing protein [Clostridium sp. JN-9]QAT40614.1 hypothetical protein EQM05_10260 [Clostridium sp. JN-9]
MHKGRQVGTFTAGIVLIMFGILFLLRLSFPNISISMIVSLWPLILVFLGIEIIAAYVINKEEKIRYDTGAITLIIILSFFAMGMAGAEFVINHLTQLRNII